MGSSYLLVAKPLGTTIPSDPDKRSRFQLTSTKSR